MEYKLCFVVLSIRCVYVLLRYKLLVDTNFG